MTVVEQMERDYGTTRKALEVCIAMGMSNSEIGRKYNCTDTYIGKKLKSECIVNKNKGSKWRKFDDSPTVGEASAKSRKEVTTACLRGEELSRANLLAQVKHYRRGDPGFEELSTLYKRRM